jgi:hypothetical protein
MLTVQGGWSPSGAGEAKLAGKTVVGVWKAEAQGLPYVTMTVTNEGGSLSGAVLFYLQRKDGAGHVTASAGVPEPLLHPRFDGRTLAFDVSHRRAHPPGSLQDPPVHFRLALTDRDRATLMKANVPASSVTLVRGEY